MDHQHQRLEAAIKRKDAAQRNVQRLQGRLAAAQDDVVSIEKECHERGIQPDKLDAAIAQLERRYEDAVAVFEKDIITVEGKLAPFVEDRT
jgi:predicted nuclease with TOPRIM domain